MRKILLPVAACVALVAMPAFAQTAGNSGNLLGGTGAALGTALNGPGTVTRPIAGAATAPIGSAAKQIGSAEHQVPVIVSNTLNSIPVPATPVSGKR